MKKKLPQEYLFSLNKEQRYAATHLWERDTQALQVIAGAGSGKTTTLIAAVLSAIDAGYSPERIAVLTFSRRAAHELKERFAKKDTRVGYTGTMHALAWKLLRASGAQEKILLHSQEIRASILKDIFPEYQTVPIRILLSPHFLSEEKRTLLDERYENYLRTNNAIDFDAMISRATQKSAEENPFDVVFVDEFQDTSPDQVAFIRSLRAQKLFVVGDDWQSIYRFRGADVSMTRDFLQRFENAERAYLVKNYRSGSQIVRLGNRVIRMSSAFVKKQLNPTHARRHKPTLFFQPQITSIEEVWQSFLYRAFKKFSFLKEESVTVLVRTNAVRLQLEKIKPAHFEILTIHKSKGLEFNNVIVFGVHEHLLPHRDNDFDEEVRILYVALTRAKNFLGFVGWEGDDGKGRSAFLPLLMRKCRLVYL